MFELFDSTADVEITSGANLPHWYQPGVSYFVTFRTDDSLPESLSRHWHASRHDWLQRHGISPNDPQWRDQLRSLSQAVRSQFHETFSRMYLENLDKGFGPCVLKRAEIQKIVVDALMHFDGVRYHIGDFVVMPNHVHLIVCLLGETRIEDQCTSWKRFTARQINLLLNQTGRFWQEESFDHLIRTADQFAAIQRYIADNPVRLASGTFFLHQRN